MEFLEMKKAEQDVHIGQIGQANNHKARATDNLEILDEQDVAHQKRLQ